MESISDYIGKKLTWVHDKSSQVYELHGRNDLLARVTMGDRFGHSAYAESREGHWSFVHKPGRGVLVSTDGDAEIARFINYNGLLSGEGSGLFTKVSWSKPKLQYTDGRKFYWEWGSRFWGKASTFRDDESTILVSNEDKFSVQVVIDGIEKEHLPLLVTISLFLNVAKGIFD